MNPAESDRIHELCSRIAVEDDHAKFLSLVEELTRILSVDTQGSEKKADDQKID